ncbi:MAG: DNA-binding protein [Propionibacteriaceae bacterium]|uniref:Excise: DNA binding domain, excisionase family n=2 Tax=Propionibacterium TaxID=1743 RepID=A0A383S8F7_9ACTN|nr:MULTISPECIES: helix-turn-helix domain-containing protein [Propionibacterium]MBE6477648.1 DNA-binding protein [Propionibacteriaceae bacterium]RLP09493.1 helix-turn-helix domain-containing protein [Propionibacterium australiense]RLP09928.1 helix-turn-helix domain-containing protein [Propionibacterium australiense]SPF68478.1 excise: DNA binding domain, excisionase family [Propionibacterium ruminifibrarum]SYZ33842.1 excise: DNA binding domain, excisionase family [Propionibacterium australiense]
MPTVLHATAVDRGDVEMVRSLADRLGDTALSAVLTQLVSAVERGVDVALLDADKELTPNEVADILKVSRPYAVKLMDRGILAFRMVGSHRRVAMADLVDYITRHERANAHISSVLANREAAISEAMDEAAVLTDEDLAELASLD